MFLDSMLSMVNICTLMYLTTIFYWLVWLNIFTQKTENINTFTWYRQTATDQYSVNTIIPSSSWATSSSTSWQPSLPLR
jgi:hypothetical protein